MNEYPKLRSPQRAYKCCLQDIILKIRQTSSSWEARDI